jgi:hypothetical protein
LTLELAELSESGEEELHDTLLCRKAGGMFTFSDCRKPPRDSDANRTI